MYFNFSYLNLLFTDLYFQSFLKSSETLEFIESPQNIKWFFCTFEKSKVMSDSELYSKIASLPADLKKEVADFVEFLTQKKMKKKSKPLKERQFGALKGLITMAPDFDAPLDVFKGYM